MSIEVTIIVLLVIGLAFMALEAIVPAFGLLGLGGIASFMAALFMLRNMDEFMGIAVDAPLLASLGIAGLVVLGACVYFVRRAWQLRAQSGAETMIGMRAKILSWEGHEGRVLVEGEEWTAQGPEGLSAGQYARVSARDHLILTVTHEA